MVKHLLIKNYKSIKEIRIDTRRVNVFIGEHNSGKSNILEALSWFSPNALDQNVFPDLFRYKTATDFFYDFDASTPIEIKTDHLNVIIRYAKNSMGAHLDYFEGIIYSTRSGIDPLRTDLTNLKGLDFEEYVAFKIDFDGALKIEAGNINSVFRTYMFKRLKSFQNTFRPFLNPPFGENIPSLLISNKEFKELISSLFREKGFRLMLKPTEGDINMAKDVNDELYVYPYQAISETLQRIIFFMLAIESNKNSVLVMDEPESNTFPMYTKQLAELMALDTANQYFIASHNPYLLGSLVSKTPVDQLAVFITRMDNYQTIVEEVPNDKLSELLNAGTDLFFNLDKLTEK